MSEDEEASLEVRVVLKGSQVERFERIQENLGIFSRADVLRHLITVYPLPPPRFIHINTYDDHATIKDTVLNRSADVYFKEDGSVFCELCNLSSCHHIDYVLNLPSVKKILDERGWERKES